MDGKCKLSINVNKVALIRNQRLGNFPDPIKFANQCELLGADGITVHPRPDERHIRYSDIPRFKENNSTELNIEGYPSDRFLKLIEETRPDQCTLVPDPPNVLTSDTGWDVKANMTFLKETIARLKDWGVRVSIFLNPDVDQLKYAVESGTDRVELYTGNYAHDYERGREEAIRDHVSFSKEAKAVGIGLNAGHDLNRENLRYYEENVEDLLEVSIGHAFVADCLYLGLRECMIEYKNCLVREKTELVLE